MGQRHELDLVRDRVVRPLGAAFRRVQTPNQREPLHAFGDLAEEQHEGPLGKHATRLPAVRIVRVDRNPHRRAPASRASARSGGPKRRQPRMKPTPQDRCMVASTSGSAAASPARRLPAYRPGGGRDESGHPKAEQAPSHQTCPARTHDCHTESHHHTGGKHVRGGACSRGGGRSSWRDRRRSGSTGAPASAGCPAGCMRPRAREADQTSAHQRGDVRPTPHPGLRANPRPSRHSARASSRRHMPVKPLSTSISPAAAVRKPAPPAPSGVDSASATRLDQRPSPCASWGPLTWATSPRRSRSTPRDR